jgi:6-phosphogluconolactonase
MPSKAEIIRCKPASELARRGAEFFFQAAEDHVRQKGYFSVALSGGSTPRPMYGVMADQAIGKPTPWPQTHIFWVDERMVPGHSPDSNFGTTKKDLIDHIPVSDNNVHPMPTTDDVERQAVIYEAELRSFFKAHRLSEPVFDLIILGIGEDGHIASLFPGHPALFETRRWVVPVKGGQPDVHRLTLTLPVINQAKHIIFLISGSSKAGVVKEVFENPGAGLPAQKVASKDGRILWLMDQAAGAGLS